MWSYSPPRRRDPNLLMDPLAAQSIPLELLQYPAGSYSIGSSTTSKFGLSVEEGYPRDKLTGEEFARHMTNRVGGLFVDTVNLLIAIPVVSFQPIYKPWKWRKSWYPLVTLQRVFPTSPTDHLYPIGYKIQSRWPKIDLLEFSLPYTNTQNTSEIAIDLIGGCLYNPVKRLYDQENSRPPQTMENPKIQAPDSSSSEHIYNDNNNNIKSKRRERIVFSCEYLGRVSSFDFIPPRSRHLFSADPSNTSSTPPPNNSSTPPPPLIRSTNSDREKAGNMVQNGIPYDIDIRNDTAVTAKDIHQDIHPLYTLSNNTNNKSLIREHHMDTDATNDLSSNKGGNNSVKGEDISTADFKSKHLKNKTVGHPGIVGEDNIYNSCIGTHGTDTGTSHITDNSNNKNDNKNIAVNISSYANREDSERRVKDTRKDDNNNNTNTILQQQLQQQEQQEQQKNPNTWNSNISYSIDRLKEDNDNDDDDDDINNNDPLRVIPFPRQIALFELRSRLEFSPSPIDSNVMGSSMSSVESSTTKKALSIWSYRQPQQLIIGLMLRRFHRYCHDVFPYGYVAPLISEEEEERRRKGKRR